jgi:hypothetical protein
MFRRRRPADDFAAEIAAHLQLEIDRLRAEGLSPDEATAAARRAFGSVTLSTERFYESHRWYVRDQPTIRPAPGGRSGSFRCATA